MSSADGFPSASRRWTQCSFLRAGRRWRPYAGHGGVPVQHGGQGGENKLQESLPCPPGDSDWYVSEWLCGISLLQMVQSQLTIVFSFCCRGHCAEHDTPAGPDPGAASTLLCSCKWEVEESGSWGRWARRVDVFSCRLLQCRCLHICNGAVPISYRRSHMPPNKPGYSVI